MAQVAQAGFSHGLAHLRYATAGGYGIAAAQPLRGYNKNFGEFGIVHNGEVPDSCLPRQRRCDESDTEVLVSWLAESTAPTLSDAVGMLVAQIKGAYSLLAMTHTCMVATRDRHGVRPLWMLEEADRVMFASEPVGLDGMARNFREVPAGAVVTVSLVNDELSVVQCRVVEACEAGCALERIYFERALRNGELRRDLGRCLSRVSPELTGRLELVCGVPDGGSLAAQGFAEASGVPYCSEALEREKHRVPQRTFILPSDQIRTEAARSKYSVSPWAVRNRVVGVVDDSLIRATTAPVFTKQLFAADAREVHVFIASPPTIRPCYFGFAYQNSDVLPAARMTPSELNSRLVGATSLTYLPLDSFTEIVERDGPKCTGCWGGRYAFEI